MNPYVGYGFSWYDPVCGYACNNAITNALLSCTLVKSTGGRSMSAYCMNPTCDPFKVPTWQRKKFWATKMTGNQVVMPKWDYARALEEAREMSTIEFNFSSGSTLKQTVLVSDAIYKIQSNFIVMSDCLEGLQARYM